MQKHGFYMAYTTPGIFVTCHSQPPHFLSALYCLIKNHKTIALFLHGNILHLWQVLSSYFYMLLTVIHKYDENG